jgi:hypothetical protein
MAPPAMFGHAQAMHRHRAAACGIPARRFGNQMSRNTGHLRRGLRRAGLHHLHPLFKALRTVAHKTPIDQAFLYEDVPESVQERHVRAGMHLQVEIREAG